MFRKEEQALAMWSPENVAACAKRQAEILEQAAVMVKSGGELVYSTCTFAPAEDENSILSFLERHPEFSMTDLPEKLGEKREAFGFDTGHPEWCGKPEGAEELRKAVRLWPHRLEGEGHFAAVLQKTGRAASGRDSFGRRSSCGSRRFYPGYAAGRFYGPPCTALRKQSQVVWR